MRRSTYSYVLTAAVLASVAAPAGAQMLPDAGAPAARDAQRKFELFRRSHLPRTPRDDIPCDARVGRFCYWDTNEDAPPRAEPP